ncbi:hypothetical protein [Bacteroides acidifaciens]|jgi:hypothetical protein|uniref:hypothetical protein n=2 Tax=Bacteroidia TaxID=200643 RepID=UPI00255830C6|nr:hypothetical protein [Bacteroides acidifaciens]
MMTTMTDSEFLEKYQQPFPVSFKVIGNGTGTTDIIKKVKSFGYDCVGCFIAESPRDCITMDDDKMVIIVARDNEEVANAIAKTYHDAGVLTIGLVYKPNIACYDSVTTDSRYEDFPEIIKTLLQPIVTQGYICFDFNDLCTMLHDSGYFKTLTAEGKNIEEAVNSMKKELEKVPTQHIECLSAHLYFNRKRQPTITMTDMKHLSEMISTLQKSINVIWSVNFDDTLPYDLIRFSIIISGNEL